MNDFKIFERKTEAHPNLIILDLEGKLTITHGSTELRNRFKLLSESGVRNVILDMSGVGYIDARGIGELFSGNTLFKKKGGKVKLLKITQKVQDLLVITRLYNVFDVFDDERKALDSF